MCEKKREGVDLPEEITEDILSRLPVKSLMRFMCVCKTWGAVLRNPRFIYAHHHRQEALEGYDFSNSKFLLRRSYSEILNTDIPALLKSPYCQMLPPDDFPAKRFYIRMMQWRRERHFTTLECIIDKGEIVGAEENEKISFPFLALEKGPILQAYDNEIPYVFGPCNGILCLDKLEDVALWNPATREFNVLPQPTIKGRPHFKITSSHVAAFGYDCKTNDYKVLRNVCYDVTDEEEDSGLQVQLYSLKNNHTKEIDCDNNFGFRRPEFNTCIDRFYHQELTSREVLSFDMVDEVFMETRYPSFGNNLFSTVRLASFNKYLAAIVNARSGENNEACFDIWLLKEVGVTESWMKQLRIGPIHGVCRPLGFWKKDRMFVEIGGGEELALYNPETKELKTLGIRSYKHSTRLINYVESLVPINGRREHEEGIVRFKSQTPSKDEDEH